MIFDKLDSLILYSDAVPQFKAIAEYLKEHNPAALAPGRYELGGGVFMNVSEYEPYAAADKWEAHKKYADLQIVVAGNERMDGAPISACKGASEYNAEGDFMFYDACEGSYASVFGEAGCFAYFAPGDAHRPGIRCTAEKVKKAVVKIPV